MKMYKNKTRKCMMLELLFIITLIAISQVGEAEGRDESTMKAPMSLPWYDWAEGIVNKHFTNMTSEIVKDALIKLRSAKQIQAKFKNKAMYKVGVITANIQTLFEKILIIYRDVSDLRKVRDRFWLDEVNFSAVNDTINGLSIAQSYFNRIRLEKRVFQAEMKEMALNAQREKRKKERQYGPLPPGGPVVLDLPKGGMYSRRLNSDDFQIPLDEDGIPIFSLPKLPSIGLKTTRRSETRRKFQSDFNPKKDSRPALANSKPPGLPNSMSEANKELEFSLQALKKRGRRLFGGVMPESKGTEFESHQNYMKTPEKHSYDLGHVESEKKESTVRPTKKRLWKVGVI